MEYANDNGTPVARTRRWERDRGFTRGAFVIVPDWEPLQYGTDDDDIAARMELEQTYALMDAESVSVARTAVALAHLFA